MSIDSFGEPVLWGTHRLQLFCILWNRLSVVDLVAGTKHFKPNHKTRRTYALVELLANSSYIAPQLDGFKRLAWQSQPQLVNVWHPPLEIYVFINNDGRRWGWIIVSRLLGYIVYLSRWRHLVWDGDGIVLTIYTIKQILKSTRITSGYTPIRVVRLRSSDTNQINGKQLPS